MGPAAIDRLFRADPPREPLTSLAAAWRDFQWRRLDQGHRDPCIEYTSRAADISFAIQRACDSRGADGKLFFHQGRVWQVNRDVYCETLLTYRKLIRKARDFHDLWDLCDSVGQLTNGIGPITIYDVTARLAAYLGLKADRIYLHGGVVSGVHSIGIETKGKQWIERDELPRTLRRVPNLDHVEDFLCGYRVVIERVKEGYYS